MENLKKTKNKFELMSFGKLSLETSKLPKKKVIWAGIREGSFGFIFGPGKSGKTTFGENLAISLVVGRSEFWGKKLYDGNPQRVLFISFEENCIPRVERAKKQIKGLTDDEKLLIAENYIQPGCDFQQNISSTKDWNLLSDAIKSSNCKIVFIDSLTRLYSGAIEDSQTAQQVLLNLRKLSRDLGLTIICIHHTTKGQNKAITQDSLAGSRVVIQEADFGIAINKTSTGHRYLKEVFYRYEKQSDTQVIEFSIEPDLWLKPLGIVEEYKLFRTYDGRENNENLESVRKLIPKIADEDKLFKSKELVDRLVKTGEMAKNTLYTHLKKLIEKGEILKKADGLYKLNTTIVNLASDGE